MQMGKIFTIIRRFVMIQNGLYLAKIEINLNIICKINWISTGFFFSYFFDEIDMNLYIEW